MARSPGGKSVGRVSIRVIPDTSRFREDLKVALQRIERDTRIEVDASLSAREQFRKDVHDLVNDAERNKVNLAVAASTAHATAQLRYVSRPRTIPLIVKVQKASLAAAEVLLGRLSGLRAIKDFSKDILDMITGLDKSLPKVALLTTGITSGVSVILSALSGILGVGAGLVAILPSLLLLPGLIAGAAVSIAVLAIALSDAKTQLAALAPSMRELRDLIRDKFWSEAREPIVSLISTLMPQLRASFGETATAIGGFTASLAGSFEKAFGGGRFEAVFRGIPDTFKELSRGTDAFAGAIVSLGLVAGRYIPRLARWFVDLSIRFDTFLKRTAEDGRLDAWMEGAIKAMNDLWRATAAAGSTLTGLWHAADQAGGAGLAGFADNLERISAAVNGSAFQATLGAIFRGANYASGQVADGLRSIGTLLHDRRTDLLVFIELAGQAFGGLLTDIANALNTPEVGGALREFIIGIKNGLAGFGRYLPEIAKGASSLLAFAGDFANILGPILGSAGAALSGVLQPILDGLGDGTLQALGATIKSALDNLGPKLAETASTLAPMIDAVLQLATVIIPELSEKVGDLLDGFNTNTEADRGETNVWTTLGELIRSGNVGTFLQQMNDLLTGQDVIINGLNGDYGVLWQQITNGAATLGTWIGTGLRTAYLLVSTVVDDMVNKFTVGTQLIFGMLAALGAQVAAALIGVVTTVNNIPTTIIRVFAGAGSWLYQAGRDLIAGFVNGIGSAVANLAAAAANAALTALNAAKRALGIKSPSKRFEDEVGVQSILGWARGIRATAHLIPEELARAAVLPDIPVFDVASALGTSSGSGAGLLGNAPQVSLVVNNPVGVPTEETVRTSSQLIGAALSV